MLPPPAQSWIAEGRAERLADTISSQFSDYVHSLPWAGTTGLDWLRMPSCRSINISDASETELARWIRSTGLGRHTHAALWYSAEQGGIVLPSQLLSGALDELFQHSAGVRFVFGIDAIGEHPDFASILQWGLGDLLFATA